ncbi:uncharacterized protein LOC117315150 [Pecten maximus]|uniref:uncharacterized protein LOC117315150 n=1 Tax=Pecten maximus TaxID=6579 RepID=UPI0014590C2C|nr:uncharacterized protein LOC117315150 [Pecten maximus]
MQSMTCLGVLAFQVVVLLSQTYTVESQLQCGNKHCDSHHDSCQLHNTNHWHCADTKHCRSICDPHHDDHENHECCCHTQDCIDNFNHHHAPVTMDPFANLGVQLVCGADICSTPEEPFCVLHHQAFECDHHCDEHHMCRQEHLDPHGNLPDCCCKTQACIDFVNSTYHVKLSGVKCPDCPNVQHNDCHGDPHHRCTPHELCKAIVDSNGIVSTRCEKKVDCLREQMGNVFTSSDRKQVCCDTQTCLNQAHNAMSATTTAAPTSAATPASSPAASLTTNMPTTTATPFYCPVCTDAFNGNCSQNAICAPNEGCMLLVNAGKLQTGCIELTDCKYHERIGDSVCCTDKNCTDHAFKRMTSASFTCPTCQSAQDPLSCMNLQQKCSYLSKGCMVTHSQSGLSSGCSTHTKHCEVAEAANSLLCHVHPIPFSYSPGLQCSFCCHNNDSTCMIDALGIHDVTPAPTAGTSGCVDHDDATFSCTDYDRLYGMCSSTDPMMMHLVDTKCRKTCGKCPVSAFQCVDKIGTCAGMASFLCSSTDPSSQTYARENCAKTCNLCVTATTTTAAPCVDTDNTCSGMASFLCLSADPVSQEYAKEHCAKTCNLCGASSTPSPTECVDHDLNSNCQTLANSLCTSQDSHVRNFAIASCAKTCNLCTEYIQHLAGLTVPAMG